MTTGQIQKELDTNIDKDVISTREQSGMTLSYLETWYVIDRLNQVLGQGNWSYTVDTLTKVFEGKVTQRSGEVFSTSYTALVNLHVTIEGRTVVFSDVGYGSGTNKNNPGDAHEMATKGAVSDGIKRAAKNLGRSVGLALYDKEQQYVGTEKPKDEVKLATAPIVGRVTTTDTKQVEQTKTIGSNTKDLITASFKVLEAQKKITKEAFKMNYLGNRGISTVAPSELPAIFERMKKDYPQLNSNGAKS